MATKKKLTRSAFILGLLDKSWMSCQEIVAKVIKKYKLTDNKAKYASGSVSSTLARMVKQGIVEVSESKAGPKGGKIYRHKIYNPKSANYE